MAAVVAVVTILAAIASRPLAFQDAFLDSLAALALGAVFGSTATANGIKSSQVVIEGKIDAAADAARSAATAAALAAANGSSAIGAATPAGTPDDPVYVEPAP